MLLFNIRPVIFPCTVTLMWIFYCNQIIEVAMLYIFYLRDEPPPDPIKPQQKHNVPFLVLCKVLCGVLASAAEAKTSGVFHKS